MVNRRRIEGTRYAEVISGHATLREVRAYLPSNYEAWSGDDGVVWIKGEDEAGWTLHDYVIPRLESGMIIAREVKLGAR